MNNNTHRYNTAPCVSVIVPVYIVERYLHQCVNSLLNQTLKNIEIILVDDGSSDDTYLYLVYHLKWCWR